MVQDKDQLLYIEQYSGSIDTLAFHGASVSELEEMFHQSIDNYLELCGEFGKTPEKEYKGRFPLWLSPTQVKILPISDEQLEYAKIIEKELLKNKIRVKVDNRAEKIGYKIREAELERVPYMLILGKKEAEEGIVSIRRRGNKENDVMSLEEFVIKLLKEIEEKEIF